MLYQCLPFLFALFKCHCGSPHVFINETRKPPLERAVADEQRSKRLTNTASSLKRDKYQCKQRIGGST